MRCARICFLSVVVIAALFGRTVRAGGGEPHRGKASKEARKGLPVKEIEGVIREYLLRNPEVVEDALRRLQEKRQRAKAAATKRVIARRARDLFRDPESPVGGNPDGDVTLVEFFDYRCVHCRRIAPMMSKAEQGDPNLRIVYKEFPILGPGSSLASRAALASRRQGKYLVFHKALMRTKNPFTEEGILRTAAFVGIDTARLRKDMEAPDVLRTIRRNYALARALGIGGTPAFVVGDELIPGAVELETLRALIARSRSK
ncbi:MAG: DsbA family protein [Nitrospinota bacterium]|jgi:protein-disulfide isomerase|nr:DsbA family protein [Nitrospinota bacterium]